MNHSTDKDKIRLLLLIRGLLSAFEVVLPLTDLGKKFKLGFKAQWEIPDAAIVAHLILLDNKIVTGLSRIEDPHVLIRFKDTMHATRILTGKMNMETAFMEGCYTAKGELSDIAELGKLVEKISDYNAYLR